MRGNIVMRGYFDDEAATARGLPRRLVPLRRPRGVAPRRQRRAPRPRQGHHHLRRREHLHIEVEQAIVVHPAVLECAVVAVPHEHWGERPKAFVTLKDGAEATRGRALEHCRERLAHFKCPDAVEFGPLPKTSTGKVQKFVLREREWAGHGARRIGGGDARLRPRPAVRRSSRRPSPTSTTLVATARRADELGLDLVGVQDHPYQPRFLDTWTLLSTIAAETERIRLFPDVANLPLRPPAVLARAAASLDLLSGGRVELGLGAGAFWDAIEANGGPRRTPRRVGGRAGGGHRRSSAALWADARQRRGSRAYYRAARRAARPAAGASDRHLARRVRPAHAAADRPPRRRLDAVLPRTCRSSSSARHDGAHRRRRGGSRPRPRRDPPPLQRQRRLPGERRRLPARPAAPLDRAARRLALEHGISAFVLAVDPSAPADLRRFAEEVAPGVRDAVGRERGEPPAESPPPSSEDDATPVLTRRPSAPAPERGRGDHGRRRRRAAAPAAGARPPALGAGPAAGGDRAAQAGLRDPAWVRTVLARLTNRQNWCSVGAFCAGYPPRRHPPHHRGSPPVPRPARQGGGAGAGPEAPGARARGDRGGAPIARRCPRRDAGRPRADRRRSRGAPAPRGAPALAPHVRGGGAARAHGRLGITV